MTDHAERVRGAWAAGQAAFAALEQDMAGTAGATEQQLRDAWALAARVLEAVAGASTTGAPGHAASAHATPSGQSEPQEIVPAAPLVAALRARGLCTLDEAHTLIDLHASAARVGADGERVLAGSEMARQQVVRAREVLDRVVRTALTPATPAVSGPASAASVPLTAAAGGVGRVAEPAASAPPAPPTQTAAPAAAVSGRRSSALVVAFVVLCLVGAAATVALFTVVRRDNPVEQGVAAYEAGQRTAARVAFEQARVADSTNALPLVYLGRLAREEGDLTGARRLLEQAVQLDPGNPLTHRELAAALLADGNPELARRFYVRAITINADDRVAQGFLACALHRLGRVDEAARWYERAGPGDWTACLETPPPAPSVNP